LWGLGEALPSADRGDMAWMVAVMLRPYEILIFVAEIDPRLFCEFINGLCLLRKSRGSVLLQVSFANLLSICLQIVMLV
jgi:hypothetical protein